jgi:hypothetical protein
VPSVPEPFFAAVHASQVAEHGLSQQTPSAQLPLVQSVAAEHGLGVHGLAAYFSQPPEPSHKPSWPQAGAPSSLQLPCGSFPARAAPQTPSASPVEAFEQAKHFVVHAVSQQTPSTHAFERHVSPVVQAAPFLSSDKTSAVAVAAVADVFPPVTSKRPSVSAVNV